MDEAALRTVAEQLRRQVGSVVADPREAAVVVADLDAALARPSGAAARALRRALSSHPAARAWVAAQREQRSIGDRLMSAASDDDVPARYLTVEHPEHALPNVELPLQVSITEQPRDRSGVCQRFAVPAAGIDVRLVVNDVPGLRVVKSSMQEVRVPQHGDSQPVLFLLEARFPGLHTVTVRAYLDGRPVGEHNVTVDVGAGRGSDVDRVTSATIPSLELNRRDLTLQIDRLGDGYHCRLFHPGDSVHGIVNRIPSEIVERVRAQLFRIVTGRVSRADPRMPQHDLRDLGLHLWQKALPDQVQQRFDDLVSSADSLTVVTDDHYDIPWELLLPTPSGQAETPFLAETLPVLRRITGQSYQRVLRIREAAYVYQARLSDTGTEVEEVQWLLGEQVSHRRPPFVRTGDLVRYIDAGRFDLLHLACHNDTPRWSWPTVAMADDPFYCFNLQTAIKNKALSNRQPMIFFNACNANSQPADTHMAGWAENFLLAGAGAFIGSAWAVPSPTAKDYAVALYSALKDPAVASNLGRASLLARRTLSGSGDPTRLAYAVYAGVDTVVKWGKT
jgi:hypothetical protein